MYDVFSDSLTTVRGTGYVYQTFERVKVSFISRWHERDDPKLVCAILREARESIGFLNEALETFVMQRGARAIRDR